MLNIVKSTEALREGGKKLFSGIQPSGEIHIGNYVGALRQWVSLQDEYESIFSVVDLHAITVDYDPAKMPEKVIGAAKDLIAIGIDPAKSTLFVQSHRPEHTELAWILNSITAIGELNRMTQYKEKSAKHSEKVGLFDYPVLQAADILIYKAEAVPVGEDQVQHVELARTLAQRFNSKFGQVFPEPKEVLVEGARVLGLDGKGKMSKSNAPATYIGLNDDPETIRKKIGSAITDDGKAAEISAGTKNLIGLIGIFAGKEVEEKYMKEREAGTIKYSEFKPALAEAIIKTLEPIQKRRAEISDDEVKKILADGAEKLAQPARDTLKEVKAKMGLNIA